MKYSDQDTMHEALIEKKLFELTADGRIICKDFDLFLEKTSSNLLEIVKRILLNLPDHDIKEKVFYVEWIHKIDEKLSNLMWASANQEIFATSQSSICDHDKIYEDKILLSYPAKRNWICKKCGERGQEVIGEYYKESEYNILCEKFRKTDAVDVSTGFTITTTQQGTAALPEITQIICKPASILE